MFCPHTQEEINEMLATLGYKDIEELFSVIPSYLRIKEIGLEKGKEEAEVVRHLSYLASLNSSNLKLFIGAGFYDHYIPSAVEHLMRTEFYTAYTPYQPEASQGTLQAIYEYQTAMCGLTEMEVSNASLYDGGTALYEAMMMAVRITGRTKIVVDEGVNPIYRKMIYCYTNNLNLSFEEIPSKDFSLDKIRLFDAIDNNTAAVLLQNPNFFGTIEDYSDVISYIHEHNALAIVSCYPISLGMILTPGRMNVDIATGEGQSLGIPLAFGGPYLGFLCTRKKYIRSMPGRLVGRTFRKDSKEEAFVLTLQTREQHIRREKATSNICSNESLCALRAVVYLSLLGPSGLKTVAYNCYKKTQYLKELLGKIKKIKVFENICFNEFVVELPLEAGEVINRMIERGFVAGFPLGRYYKGKENMLLIAVTEKRTKEEIGIFAEVLESVI